MDITLVKPDAKYERSFREAFAELTDEMDQHAWIYLGLADQHLYFDLSFADYVTELNGRAVVAPKHFVRTPTYWAIHDGEVVGRISLRLELNDMLRRVGGHIGYITRPSYRGKGVATAMLHEILKLDATKKIGKLLVTCDAGNVASEKTIRKCGGIYQDTIEVRPGQPLKQRFRITIDDKRTQG